MVNDGPAPAPGRAMTAATPNIRADAPGSASHSPALEAGLLSILALVVYWITGPSASGDMWPPLAEAFLSGRLHLAEDRPWLELVPRAAGDGKATAGS